MKEAILCENEEKKPKNHVQFGGYDCRLIFNFLRYPCTGHVQIHLVDDGGPVATATVYNPCCLLASNQVLIKDYAENEGILRALEKAGILERTCDTYPVGYCEADICTLIVDPIKFMGGE